MTDAQTGALTRRPPPLGGFSTTLLSIELRRTARNRRTLVFTVVLPPVFFLLFSSAPGADQRVGSGNVIAYLLVSMAVYGGMLASTSAGAGVSVERAAGWSRQLRLTPLRPVAYIATKLLVALSLSALAVAVVYAVGLTSGASMPAGVWVATALLAWVCSLVFAAFGLFMGYLLPSENVMQVLGPVLALLSFAGGLFVPLEAFGPTFRALARLTPVYGVGELARTPLTHDGHLLAAVVNVVVWTTVFTTGAALRFRRDTARV